MLFLSALPREQALLFVSDALAALRRVLQHAQKECRENARGEAQFAHFAARNGLRVTRARVKWLAEVQGRLEAFAVGERDWADSRSRSPVMWSAVPLVDPNRSPRRYCRLQTHGALASTSAAIAPLA